MSHTSKIFTTMMMKADRKRDLRSNELISSKLSYIIHSCVKRFCFFYRSKTDDMSAHQDVQFNVYQTPYELSLARSTRRKIDVKLGEEEHKEYYNARQNPIRDVHKDTQTVATSRADKNERRKLSGTRNRRAIIPEYQSGQSLNFIYKFILYLKRETDCDD